VSMTGGAVAHNNMQPFLAVQYCICIAGGEIPAPGDLPAES
jgi:microcystin-dependent protein